MPGWTHTAGLIRLASALDVIHGPTTTETTVRLALGLHPPPEGRYGPLRTRVHAERAYSCDPNWGHVVIWGDLWGYTDSESIKNWWIGLLNELASRRIDVVLGVLQIAVDGKAIEIVDHLGECRSG